MTTLFAAGLGIGTQNRHGEWLEVHYAAPLFRPSPAVVDALLETLGGDIDNRIATLDARTLEALEQAFDNAGADQQARLAARLSRARQPVIMTLLADDLAPATVPEAYLKLQLLSHRLARPHDLDLSGIFAVLPNVAWTSRGAIDLDELPDAILDARLQGKHLEVHAVDKFPRMLNYVAPDGVRVGDAARIRLGAYLGTGTTVMQEGFVNFNAGTEGPSMVEGRISAGVFVGRGSDLGGGSSTMGTLSGGNNVVIGIGQECLIGANAGVGIPLGDRCTIEAGLYITAGSVVSLIDASGQPVRSVKARELAGQSGLQFRRNSQTGAIEARANRSAVELNAALHDHN